MRRKGPNHLGVTKYVRTPAEVRESVYMITNHHIAIQIANERQRDLRASSGGWSLADLFGRWFGRPLPGRVAGDQLPARGTEAAPSPAPSAARRKAVAGHVHRSPVAPGRHIARRSRRAARGRERTPS